MTFVQRISLLILAAVALIAAAFLLLRTGLPQRAVYTGAIATDGLLYAPEVDALAPPFQLTLLNGQSVQLQGLLGDVLIVNFWATWCVPCKQEMPQLQELYETYASTGLRIIGINMGEGPSSVSAWVQEMGLTFDIALDVVGNVTGAYQVRVQPMTFVIAPDGIIKHIFFGETTAQALEAVITPYLSEPVRGEN